MKRNRVKTRVRDLGPEFKLRTERWAHGIGDKTARIVDQAVSKDENVIKSGMEAASLVDKVLCLEIKRWRIVTQLTDRIVAQLFGQELSALITGWAQDLTEKEKYAFRALCRKHNISTKPLGVTRMGQNRAEFCVAKSGGKEMRVELPLSLDQLYCKLERQYALLIEAFSIAQDTVLDIMEDVKAMRTAESAPACGDGESSLKTTAAVASSVQPIELINVDDLAKKLLCCPRTIMRAVNAGHIAPCSVGALLFEKRDVLEFLNKHRKGMASQLGDIPDDFLTTIGVAEALKIKRSALRLWIKTWDKTDIPHYRMSKTWVLFLMADVNRWFLNRKAIIHNLKYPGADRIKRAREYFNRLRAERSAPKKK